MFRGIFRKFYQSFKDVFKFMRHFTKKSVQMISQDFAYLLSAEFNASLKCFEVVDWLQRVIALIHFICWS